jgi:two-component system sensor kinase
MTSIDEFPRAAPAHEGELVEGRFELVALLKRGNGIDTYRGTDRLQGTEVVVKAIDTASMPTAVYLRLQHEARLLERVDLGATRRVIWCGQRDRHFFVVQPRVPGEPLDQMLARDGPIDVAASLRLAADILTTLEGVHQVGVVHRDVKPPNILVEDGERLKAELVDFGLSRGSAFDDSERSDPTAAVRYMAPEAAGLINATVDQRADLYSLGVVLFECLTGARPFDGDTVGEVLRRHLNTEPPQLRSFGIAAPRSLEGVLQRLLAKDPGARYQSAAAALLDVEEIRAGLKAGFVEPSVTPGQRDLRHVLAEPAFVARTEELSELIATLDRPAGASRRLVLVEAESGAGKTRLLQELSLYATQRDVLVLRGQGVDQAAPRPFQMLEGIAEGIVASALDAELAPGGGVRGLLGDRADAAVAALPALAAVLGPVDLSGLGPEQYGEARSIDALLRLLEVLGEASRDVLILLDDCQWADAMTLKLLDQWQDRQAGDAADRLIVVAAFRSEEVMAGHPLRSVDPTSVVTLRPFSAVDVEALCESMAGPLPDEAVTSVVRLADGSPFMASAVLRGMVETGALRAGREGWEIDPGPMADVQTSRRAALILQRRFELLSPDTIGFLSIGAVLGKEFDLSLAIALSGHDARRITPALDSARRRRILWVTEADGRCAFTHDKLRETLLGGLDPTERGRLHLAAAERIEATDPDRAFELAYHFDAAGETARAMPHALRAAREARARHALDVAVTHYQIAERAAAGQDALSARLAEELGEVLMLQGDYPAATRHLEHALELSDDDVARAVINGKLGDVAFKQGDQVTAARSLEGALRALGRWVPRTRLTTVLAVAFESFVQCLHTLFPRTFLARRSAEGAEREFVAIRLYSNLAHVYWFSAGKFSCAWTHLREMNLAERYPPSPELAQAYSEHAPVMTTVPWYSRGLAYAQRSLAIRSESGDVWGQGQSLSFVATVLYASSQFRECIDACRESIRLLERTGGRWEQNTALWHLAFAHYRLGELDAGLEVARDLYYTATSIGDATAAGIALSGWARAGVGRVPEAFVAMEIGRDLGDAHTSTEVHLADGVRLLYAGQADAAVQRFTEALAIIADAGLHAEYFAPSRPWLATGLRVQAELVDPAERRARARLLRRATRAARRAHRLARSYRNNLPHALRERAVVATLRGQKRRAGRWFAAGLRTSEAQGALYETALTREAMARLAEDKGHPQGRGALSETELERMRLEPQEPQEPQTSYSLADRFEQLLDVGRRIGAAVSPAAVYEEVHQAALLMLRGDHCNVVRVGDAIDDLIVSDSGSMVPDISPNLMRQAIDQMVPVVSGTLSDVDESDSMLLADLRSILCAPIVSEGRVVACFNVTHHRVNDLFGDVEIQLAEFIATLAGAALERVAGSEAHFRSLAQNSSDVTTIVNRTGRITYQSSSVEQVFGFAPDEMVGRDLASWLHPEDAAQLLSYLDPEADDEPGHGLVQARMRHRDGSWRVGESAVRGLFDDPSVAGLVLNTRDASERVALEAELRDRASHDPLTRLANRSLFVDRVEDAFARRQHQGHPLAVIFLDLDDFKSINDTRGHWVGDQLLRLTSTRLEQCVRPGDTVARWGGDEFALLLENADTPDVEVIVRRIIAALGHPYRINDQEILSRASVGVAVAGDGETAEEVLLGADVAMYVAKSRGKSRYQFFEAEMRDAAIERSALRNDLEWALQRGELSVVYQPIVELSDSSLRGFEALLRWQHPTRGDLPPDQWIKLAEGSGMIRAIGRWVLRNACQQVAEWRRSSGRELFVAVNVSARQLQDPGFVDEIASALGEAQLCPGALVLEITESATADDPEAAIAQLESLRSLGVELSIDDFGTGYSSLSYLRRYPVQHLKVDRSFVSEVVTNPEDHAIVSSVINLAHSLGLHVIAEGVEDAAQLNELRGMGCDQAQGFFWRVPSPVDEISAWLASTPAPR